MGSTLFFMISTLILCQMLSFDRFGEKRTHWVICSTTRNEPTGSYVLHQQKTNPLGHMFYNENEPIGSYVLHQQKTNPLGHIFYINEKRTHWVICSTLEKNEPTRSY